MIGFEEMSEAEIDAFIFAIADGVGGHVAGERASVGNPNDQQPRREPQP